MATIFDKILDGEILCYKVYEDEHTLVFLDINPSVKGYLLVIPKERKASLAELSDASSAALIHTTQKMNRLLKEKLNCDGINHLLADGSAAGQEVMHVHMHVIPRYKNDSLSIHTKDKVLDLSKDEFKEIQSQLQTA
jgi:histidine triad (HIT) family protein